MAQSDLAGAMGVSVRTVANWESDDPSRAITKMGEILLEVMLARHREAWRRE